MKNLPPFFQYLLNPRPSFLDTRESYKMGFLCPSDCPSIHPSIPLSWRFLRTLSLVLSKFWHVFSIYMKLCMTVRFLEKNYFETKIRENGPKMDQKWDFLNLMKNLVINFFSIWSIKKDCIICCILAQIPYLRKI